MPPRHNLPQPASSAERVQMLARCFKLPTVAAEIAGRLAAAGQEAMDILAEVFEMEAQDRHERRVQRLRRESHLPPDKTFATLDIKLFPKPLRHRVRELARGDFVERAENVLAFGLPGGGKTHALCAIGHTLVEAGCSVRFTPTFRLVQELLAAKRDLGLPRALRKLDNFEVLILDDIGYVQQTAEEVDVLFTLLAERYERRSVMITSNLVFSQWDQIFKNPMATAAAIDRVVHHATILEFNLPSYRTEQARRRTRRGEDPTPEPAGPTEEPDSESDSAA